MPLYDFRCTECSAQFEQWFRSFDISGAVCPSCGSEKVEKQISIPAMIRAGRPKEPSNERLAKDEEVRYYEKRKDYIRAARAAEKAGQQDWQVKDLYQKAGKDPYGIKK